MTHKPPAFLHVDMDGLWAVRRCYARPEGDSFQDDPVWKQGTEEFRALLAESRVPASFFVVGRDMLVEEKRLAARRLADDGHEIANHSWQHRLGLTRLGVGAILADMRRAHEAIRRAGLPPPVGFRAPGYDVDTRVVRIARRMGYLYDASLLPTHLGPLLRGADALLARRWQPGKRQFGRFTHGFAPRRPYHPDPYDFRRPARERPPMPLLEIPVTTLAPWGLPLTGSAIFARGPERIIAALERQRPRARPVLLLLHGIDLTDCDRPIVFGNRTPRLGGFCLRAEDKRRLIEPVVRWLADNYDIVRTDEYARRYFPHRGDRP